jgi:hypothetical protein
MNPKSIKTMCWLHGQVWWVADGAWYTGTINAFEDGKGHHVKYDDGEEEWLDLTKEKHMLLRGEATITYKLLPISSHCALSSDRKRHTHQPAICE